MPAAMGTYSVAAAAACQVAVASSKSILIKLGYMYFLNFNTDAPTNQSACLLVIPIGSFSACILLQLPYRENDPDGEVFFMIIRRR